MCLTCYRFKLQIGFRSKVRLDGSCKLLSPFLFVPPHQPQPHHHPAIRNLLLVCDSSSGVWCRAVLRIRRVYAKVCK